MPISVTIPPSVEAEIEAIGDYVAQDNPPAARRLVENLYRRCRSLEQFPQRGTPYGTHYRFLVEGSYLLVYRLEEDSEDTLVILVAVFHAARDIERVLRSNDDA